MASANFEVIVKGVKDVERAFTETALTVDPVLAKALREAAKPVQKTAQDLAVANISNIGRSWSRMKIGRSKLTIYVAERQKGVRGGSPQARPNLGLALMARALVPALEQNKAEVIAKTKLAIDELCKEASA